MSKFILTYARVVYLTREIEAETEGDAYDIALELEEKGELGLEEVTAVDGSEVNSIIDYDVVWFADKKEESE